MGVDYIVMVLVTSLSSASILILATLGLAIIFGLMGVVNLAHGEFLMFGAYAALMFTRLDVPFPIAVLIATLITGLFGALIEIIVIRRLYGRMLDTMLATWGLSMVMYQVAFLIFGAVTPGIGLSQSSISIGDYNISTYIVVLVPITLILIYIVYFLLTRTRYGMLARASISNREISQAMGISPKKLNTLTFGFGSGLAGLAGAFLLPLVSATPDMGFAFVIKGFLTVVAAGPLALTGTVAVGTLLGSASNITSSFYTSVLGDIVFFTLTIILLRLYPLGISNKWKFKL